MRMIRRSRLPYVVALVALLAALPFLYRSASAQSASQVAPSSLPIRM